MYDENLFYRDSRRAGAAFVQVSELKVCDGIVSAQKFMNALPQRTRAFAVDNQNLLKSGNLRVVDEFTADMFRLVDSHAANINAPCDGRRFLQKSE